MRTFEVVGIFSSGLYDYDNSWVYVPINAAQRLFGLGLGGDRRGQGREGALYLSGEHRAPSLTCQ